MSKHTQSQIDGSCHQSQTGTTISKPEHPPSMFDLSEIIMLPSEQEARDHRRDRIEGSSSRRDTHRAAVELGSFNSEKGNRHQLPALPAALLLLQSIVDRSMAGCSRKSAVVAVLGWAIDPLALAFFLICHLLLLLVVRARPVWTYTYHHRIPSLTDT